MAPLLAALAAALVWGTTPLLNNALVARLAVPTTLVATSVAIAIASVAFGAAFAPKGLGGVVADVAKNAGPRQYALVAAIAILNVLAQWLFLHAVKGHADRTAVVVAVVSTSPVFTALLGYAFLKHVLTPTNVVGLVVAIAGVVLVGM